MPLFSRLRPRGTNEAASTPAPTTGGGPKLRRLFLDDDPLRAQAFLDEFPDAEWVQTVPECLTRLAETWDEIHLDHDLGGEQFVDQAREDCGMEVVRWLCLAPRPHLRVTQFYVHSHNATAATLMGMQLMSNGYRVEMRPFGAPPLPPLPDDVSPTPPWRLGTLLRSAWRAILGRPQPLGYGYSEFRQSSGEPEASGDDLDLSWARSNFRRRAPDDEGPPPERPDFSWAPPTPMPSPRPTPERQPPVHPAPPPGD